MFGQIWSWFWRDRSGLFFLRQLRGVWRLLFDLPVWLLGIYAWHVYFSFMPVGGRDMLHAIYATPFGVLGLLSIFLYETGIGYLRDQLPLEGIGFVARLKLCVPGTVLALYRKHQGDDQYVKVLKKIKIVGAVLLALSFFTANWKHTSLKSHQLPQPEIAASMPTRSNIQVGIQPIYQTAFELGFRTFPWIDIVSPLIFFAIGLLLIKIIKLPKFRLVMGAVIIFQFFIFVLGTLGTVIPDCVSLRHAYMTSKSFTVNGVVENFTPAQIGR